MNDSADQYQYAVEELLAGRPDQAERALSLILRHAPGDRRANLILGDSLRQQGRGLQAAELYEKLLQSDPKNLDALFQLAATRKELGQLDQAVRLYEHLLELQPHHAEGLNALGAILAEQGKLSTAMDLFSRAVCIRPDFPQARLNLGVGLGMSGRLAEARQELEESLRLRPNYPDAWYNLGNVLGQLQLTTEAVCAYRRALEMRPDHQGALRNLAHLLQKEERPEQAVNLLREAVEARLDSPEAYHNLGDALLQLRRPDAAAVMLHQSLRFRPRHAEVLNSLGQAMFNLGRFRKAEACLQDALSEQPRNAKFHANLGSVLQAVGRHDEASACFDLALLFDSQCVDAHYNRAMSLLAQSKWQAAWPDFEYRFGLKGQEPRPHACPRWDGSDLRGKTIIIWAEQGLGDMIHFVRYAELLKQRGAQVVLECPPHVVPLFRNVAGIDQIITEGDAVPRYDVHAPLMSLPGLFNTTLQNVPAKVPYLTAPRERIERWRSQLSSKPGLRIGIAWRGSPRHQHDHWRSVPLRTFAPLAAVPGVELISLQRGAGFEEIDALNGRFAVWQPPEDEAATAAETLLDTAALVSCLDLVVCVDTAIGHLAGALGMPVWLALSAMPDWRWLRSGQRTPWYPTMGLYRQKRLGKWSQVFRRMARHLRDRKLG